MMAEVKVYFYDYLIFIFGIILLFTELKNIGIFIIAFMIAFYLSERIGGRNGRNK